MNLFDSPVRVQRGLISRVRNLWYRTLGVRLGGYVWMRRISIPRQWADVTLEAGAMLDDGVTLFCSGPARKDKIHVGARTYINRFTIIDASKSLSIGPQCMIGPFCFLTDQDHGLSRGVPVGKQPMEVGPVRIGGGAWLGAHVVVLKGVTIGEGAVIGAGSVVTKSVASNAIVAGVPARQIGERQ